MIKTTNLYELRKSISKFDSKYKEAQRLTLKQIDKIIATVKSYFFFTSCV